MSEQYFRKNHKYMEMAAIKTTLNAVQHTDQKIMYPTIKELKKKYESYAMAAAEIPTVASQFTAHKLLKKSKVKQIASMFDSTICQNVDGGKCAADEQQINSPAPTAVHSKQKPPIPSPRTKSKNSNTLFGSEDVFAKLTVKHKAQMYNQFINEMYKMDPKFIKHAELMAATATKAEAGGEVVNEKQASVKYLLAKLEANCALPRQRVSPFALQRIASSKTEMEKFNVKDTHPSKAKEFEDVLANHVSTLTVQLQKSPGPIPKQPRSKSLPRYKIRSKDKLESKIIVEPSHKRNNEEMRYSLPFEAYAPPKKIRRTRPERFAPKIFFQSEYLENLFLTWLSEREQKHGNEANSSTDQLLEETLTNLADNDQEKESTKSKSWQPEQTPAPPVPDNKPLNFQISSGKPQANDDSESGISLLQKITSDESQADKPEVNTNKDFDLAKRLKTARKKKLRRALNYQTDGTSAATTSTTNSTDSDMETKNKVFFSPPPTNQNNETRSTSQPSSEELDSDLLRDANSLRKIKSAYTLTPYSPSPTPTDEDDENTNYLKGKQPNSLSSFLKEKGNVKYLQRETSQTCFTATHNSSSTSQEDNEKTKHLKRETSQTWSSATKNSYPSQNKKDKIKYLKEKPSQTSFTAIKNSAEQELSPTNKVSSVDATDNACNLCDSFVDQGFETGSNDMDSPVRVPNTWTFKKQDTEQPHLFFKQMPPAAPQSGKTQSENNSRFSAPTTEEPPFRCTNSWPYQQVCGASTMPLKNRRKSLYDKESRRSSLPMQVIREDQPLEHLKTATPCATDNKEQKFSTNAPFPDRPADLAGLRTEQASQFWIKCRYFALVFDIFYNDANRLSMLHNIFRQKSCENKGLYFGIDNLTFCVSHAPGKDKLCKRLSLKTEYSLYWVSTDDLIMPFAGKRMPADKIERIFDFLQMYAAANGDIRLGIDGVEFSNVREFCDQSPKFSMESNYSMLVGLQSGSSNGLEGRNKYAWPHSKSARVSDLDRASGGSGGVNNFEEPNSSRSSISPFGDKQAGFTTSSPTEPQPQPSMRSSEVFDIFKNDSLDYIFNEECRESSPVAAAAKAQEECSSLAQEKPPLCNNRARLYCDVLEALKGTKQYLPYLQSVVKKIINNNCRDGFKSCTFQELESSLFILSRYADICLRDCHNHIDKLLDALLDHRAVTV